MDINIIDYKATHNLVIVTTRKGYSYACTWAKGDEPLTKENVLEAWRNDRKAFDPWYGRLEA